MKIFSEFIDEARRMRVLRTAHYNDSSAVRDIHDTGFRQGTRSDGTYHDKGMNVVYTTPSSRVGADYGSKRVHFKLVNPKVTNIDSPKNYGKRIKDWMRDSSDDDLANDRNHPKDSFKQSREAIRGGSKVIRVPDAHGGHDEPKKGNRGSYILLDKEVANKSIDRNPSPTVRSKDKKRRTQTQPKKRISEFLEIAEKYYAPDDKLPSGKTPEEKAEDRIDRPFSSRKRSLLQQIRLRTRVRYGADNPELNRHPSPQSDVSGGPGWMSVGDKESGIYYNVTHHGRTKDGKRVFNVTWNHSDKPSELEKNPERRTELVRSAKDVWKQDVEHRLPYGSIVTNRPTENNKYDDQKGETKKNTRSKLYQRAGFGEMNPETGKQFAQVGRQLNTKQKRKGKGRLSPLPSDTDYEFTNS